LNWITFSQFIFAVGTILLIRKVFIKREILEGFDLIGALITGIAMSFVLYQFYEWSDWIGLVAGFMQWGFWLFVIIFVARAKLRQRKRDKIQRLEAEVESMLEAQYKSQLEENKNGS